jgi:hypothetical protein
MPAPEGARDPRPHATRWLGRCQGFRVDGPGGRIGYVDEVVPTPESGPPEFLAVRGGRRGHLYLLVPADDVAGVFPLEELVLLRGPRIAAALLTPGPA